MAGNCLPPYSYVTYDVTPAQVATPVFSYGSVPMIDNTLVKHSAQICVFLNGTLQTLTTDYTVDPVTEQVTMIAVIAEDDVLKISRDTNKCDRYLDFQNNSVLDESDLDWDSYQIFYIALEAYDLAYDSIHLSDTGDCWNGRGLRACNFAQAIYNNDLVTLGQAYNLLFGAQTATVDNCVIMEFTGDGILTNFLLNDTAIPKDIDACNCLVTVDNILQDPDPATGYSYTVATNGDFAEVQFTSPPPNGAKIRVRTLQGTFVATISEGTIVGVNIADDAIGAEHINFGAGVDKRLLVLDAAGDPTARVLVHGDVSDFDTGVRENRLDQLAIPTANVSLGNQKITNLTAGSASTDAANKGQVDAALASAQAYADATADNGAGSIHTRVLAGRFSTTGTTQQEFDVGFQPDAIWIWPDIAASTYTVVTRDVFVHDGLDGAGEIDYELSTESTGWDIRIQRTANGFYYRKTVTSPVGTIACRFLAIKNTPVSN